jgi:hypothetical protein
LFRPDLTETRARRSRRFRFNLPLDTWRRQERAFGLLKKVFAKPAGIRGQQAAVVSPYWSQQFQNLPSEGDEYFD